jgi:hypothetical protein
MRTTGQTASAFAVVAALAAFADNLAYAQPQGAKSEETVVRPAIDGIFAAFDSYPLVGLADNHGLAQSMEFYEALIRDPRFARDVRNVVVEFGGAARQDVIDRYVGGELVPYKELRQVWTDTVGWSPTVQYVGYANFFAQVRQTNLTLRRDERIRVWLGDPPIAWETIETSEQLFGILATRDSHAAGIIQRNILAQGQKALVIYGGQHLHPIGAEEIALRAQWAATEPVISSLYTPTVQGLVEAEQPDAFFIVQVYDGFDDAACTARFEQTIKDWSMPALAAPVHGTTLERNMRLCASPTDVNLGFHPTMPPRLQEIIRSQYDDVLFLGDAILFHGPAASLTTSPIFPDLYLDEEYRQEISRRMEIRRGRPLSPEWGRNVPVTPRPFE